MKTKMLLCVLFLLVSSAVSFAENDQIPLNTQKKLKSIPAAVSIPSDESRLLTILKIGQRVEGENIRTTLTVDKPLPAKMRVVLYYDFLDDFVVCIFDSGRCLFGASETEEFALTWSPKKNGMSGYRVLSGKRIECITSKKSSSIRYSGLAYDLSGKKGTVYAFILEGDDLWEFSPKGTAGESHENEIFEAASNVAKSNFAYK